MPENTSTDEKRIRSANPPTMSAGVIMAKPSWNSAKLISGTVPWRVSAVIPRKRTLLKSPMNRFPSPNAKL